MSRTRRGPWTRLTRRDLAGFDDDAVKAIQYATERGALGKISNRGHVMLRNRDGQIMAVTRNSTKSKQVVMVNVKKLFGEAEQEHNHGKEDGE